MDRIIRQFTEHFAAQLPGAQHAYRIKDLQCCDFPPFLIRRIQIELQWNLDESLNFPQTDWADIQSGTVQMAWQRFVDAIHAEVKLPAGYAKAVIETAVADIVEILVQPRSSIPDILFGGEETISADELAERCELLVVYEHFARVLTGYMQRKNRDELKREECTDIIAQIDQKVTREYSPLQWTQMLDPLFRLSGGEVDSDLVRLFFEDRNMNATARRFGGPGDHINRAELTEALSSTDQINDDHKEENKSETTEIEKPPERGFLSGAGPQKAEQEEKAPKKDEEKESNFGAQKTEPLDYEAEMAKIEISSDDTVSGESLNIETTEENTSEINPEPDFEIRTENAPDLTKEEEPASLNDIFTDEQEQESTKIEPPDALSSRNAEKDREDTEEAASIWKQFMGTEPSDDAEEAELPPATGQSRINEDEDERTYTDDINRVSVLKERSTEQKRKDLEELLEDRKAFFVEKLFDESIFEYNEALHKIAQEDSWEWASKLIANNIFKRNDVNIYSRAAVDFTDRLQTYFLDKQNRNQ